MGFLQNTWINYVQRTYQQIKAQVITVLQSNVPEITDHTESNLFIKMVGIWSAIAEMLGYYTDNAAREAFIDSCRLYASAISIAKLHDYRVRGKVAATVDVTFTLNQAAGVDIIIPMGAIVSTTGGIAFYTTQAGTILAGDLFVIIPCINSIPVVGASLGVADGSEDFEVTMTPDVVDSSVALEVNNIAWTPETTLGFSGPDDQDYVGTVDGGQNYILKFGNNLNGIAPSNGDALVCDYQSTSGAAGNVPAGTVTVVTQLGITLPIGITMSVNNVSKAAGGSDAESIDQLRHRIPLSIRTKMRAVTPQDFIDIAELCSGVIKAGLSFNCGKTVDIYIVPDGGGIASGALIAAELAWLNQFKIVTTKVDVFAAGELHVQLVIDLNVLPAYSNSATAAAVLAVLTEYISYLHMDIDGQVELSNVYQKIQDTTGVNFSNVTKMVAVPYARPLDDTTPVLTWTPTVKPASNSTVQWQIIAISSTQFQLIKDTLYIGTFTFGNVVSQPEIDFLIPAGGGYVTGNQWQFVTYNYYGTIVLAEPSLPVSIDADIVINATGGTP